MGLSFDKRFMPPSPGVEGFRNYCLTTAVINVDVTHLLDSSPSALFDRLHVQRE